MGKHRNPEYKYVDTIEGALYHLTAYESAFLNLPWVISMVDPDGAFVGLSKTYQEFFNNKEIDIGSNVRDIFPEIVDESRYVFEDRFAKAINGEYQIATEFIEDKWLQAEYIPIPHELERFKGKYHVVFVVRDVTDLKQSSKDCLDFPNINQ